MPTLVEIRLTSFKSFAGEVLPIRPVTLLTGLNSAGKSNALDAIGVLARIATGDNLANALDTTRQAEGPVRGGSAGCPPHGAERFALGCTVAVGGDEIRWDVDVQTGDHLHIHGESLVLRSARKVQTLFVTDDGVGPSITARIMSGKRGIDPPTVLWRDRAVLTQVPSVLKDNQTHRGVRAAVDAVRAALAGVYHLDPVPSRMREFVPRKDVQLRRHAENLSASLVELQADQPGDFAALVDLAQKVVDEWVLDIDSVSSDLDDVMIALVERRGHPDSGRVEKTPARVMSDGLLRVLAVGTALLSDRGGLDIAGAPSPDETAGTPLLIVEEVENGLHPSQAGRVLDLLRTAGEQRGKRVLVTTHSPALLDAAEGDLNDAIVVCFRDRDSGNSRLAALPDLPGYLRAMATGSIGDNVTQGRLTRPERDAVDASAFDELFGLN
ncbi:AAA family ATPase [Rhodococcus sp. NPDC058532]|uniref:AAA family ATPase n=1 Tax=Rhodococcus sp. NPDC058532 TaxID=3346540 RepID=UPI003653D2F5